MLDRELERRGRRESQVDDVRPGRLERDAHDFMNCGPEMRLSRPRTTVRADPADSAHAPNATEYRVATSGVNPSPTRPRIPETPIIRPLSDMGQTNGYLVPMTRAFDEDAKYRLATRGVHAGQRPDPTTGAIMPPIVQTSTYVQDALGVNKGYEYARGKNPTREALERNVASLEGARHGFAFSSGMGCTDSLMKLFKSGDHVVCGENVYGGTYRLFDKILRNFGMCFTFLDTRDPQRIEDAITPKTVAVLLETPTNPLMRLTDLAAAGEIAKRRGVMMIVDNTFATPVFQRPIEHGASIVFHSTTKYLNGHSDMIGGICVLNDDNLAARIQFIATLPGQCLVNGLVARPPRHQDTRAPHAAARLERPSHR